MAVSGGTTRMGDDAERSVVDSRLRTHDLDNLSFVSSNVFVTTGAVNPTLTIAAFGLRAVKHLAADFCHATGATRPMRHHLPHN